MPEGMTATIGPDGVRRETKFQYEYAKPPDQDGMSGIDLNAVQENIKNFGTDEAMKAVSAAIQFQGLRGYQQALNSGESAEKAIAKYGPMMFYRAPQAFAPSVKALTPPVARPINALEQARIDEIKRKASLPKLPVLRSGPGGAVNAIDPSTLAVKEVVKGLVNPPAPRPEDYVTFTQKLESDQPASPAIPEGTTEKRTFLGIDALRRDKPIPARPATPFRRAGTYTEKIPKTALAMPEKQTAPATTTSPKRPTKAIAADYVQRLGREKAIEALNQEGYDLSGYAD